jgi:hypothetical protein
MNNSRTENIAADLLAEITAKPQLVHTQDKPELMDSEDLVEMEQLNVIDSLHREDNSEALVFSTFEEAEEEKNKFSSIKGVEYAIVALSASSYQLVEKEGGGIEPPSEAENNSDKVKHDGKGEVDKASEKKETEEAEFFDHPLFQYIDSVPIKKILSQKNNRKLLESRYQFRPSYRSQLGNLSLLLLCSFVMFMPWLPVHFIMDEPLREATQELFPMSYIYDGVTYLCIAGFFFTLFKMMWTRLLDRYTITDHYIESNHGIFSLEVKKHLYRTIDYVEMQQTFIGRMLNFGNLEFYSAGSSGVDNVFTGVINPKLVNALIEAQLTRSRELGDRYSNKGK